MTQKLQSLQHALQRVGFRALTLAEASAGAFAQRAGEKRCIRFEPAAFLIAFIMELESDTAIVDFLEQMAQSVFGYDLNLEQRAASTETVNEFWFVVAPEQESVTRELQWLGYNQRQPLWVRRDRTCRVPVLDPGHGGEIFPCLGWVPDHSAPSEFARADKRSGFRSRIVPEGAEYVRDVRGYNFIYSGYQERAITHCRIIAFIEPAQQRFDAAAIVAKALEQAYGEA